MIDSLKISGDKLLYEEGLFNLLNSFGKAQIVGSYDLDLLVKPDIDISIGVDKFDIDKYFSLCAELAKTFKPSRIKYLDQSIQKLSFPFTKGYYLGLHIPRDNISWKIDGWIFTKDVFEQRVEYHNMIKKQINDSNRKIIMTIKKQICDSPSYVSVELYEAVLFQNVKTIEEFYKWYKKKYLKDFVV